MRFSLLMFLLLFPAALSAFATDQDMVKGLSRSMDSMTRDAPLDPHGMGPVAIVGHSRIGADQVFELWTPLWRETQAKVRNGKMAPQEGDRLLQDEWERAIKALLKDELFFQEAEREHNSMINSIVDRFMRGGADRPRNQVANEIRRLLEQDMNKFFRQLNAEVVKDSGGSVKLHKVLESRGLSLLDWQKRLQKKAFTQSYLHQILKPRTPDPGPRQVQKYYATHPDEFSKPGTVRFRHIFFSNAMRGPERARDDAVEVWERLVDGEIGFEEAAQQFSDDGVSKGRGGLETEDEATDPEREAWLADIRTALREEPAGEVGPILESPFGCHVAVLLAVGPPQKVPFGEVRKEIEQKLQSERWEAETDRYFAVIRKNTDITITMPQFPRQLSCAYQSGQAGRREPRVYSTSWPEVRQPAKPGRRGR